MREEQREEKNIFPSSIILSLKRVYANRIYNGEKEWEFRKAFCLARADVDKDVKVIVYETAPVKKITGWFTVNLNSCYPAPEGLNIMWRKLKDWNPGVSEEEFFAYFNKPGWAHAWHIGKVKKLSVSIDPYKEGYFKRPPQSYMRVREEMVRLIIGS